jgi:hypothetical protein
MAGHLLFNSVLFVSVVVVSIQVRNIETNRKNFLVSRNKPKQTRNRSCFGLFRFEPKFFFHFEDTLDWSIKGTPTVAGTPEPVENAISKRDDCKK